ncbi:hypothetical protein Pfo_025706 [Paulownia fortunei]|nr:hypothetical protein Pfo_025706 [Paulownia fortunei]
MDIVSLYGPRDTTVLSRQATHRSESVFAGAVDRTLTVRHAGVLFWSLHGGEGALHPRVVHMLYDMGFYGVYRCGHFDMDFHLITALVERWRPETHTFHFRIGEVTVTLQDVAVIWGLPVDGQPVIGVDPRKSTEQWQDYCHHYLGFRPTSQQFRGGRILLSALRGYLEANPVTDDTPHNELERYARGCALILLGSIMCPDSSSNGVSLLYLQSMEQIKDVVYFSWGSAILSFMYRELCNASDKDKNVIGGAMVLLQFIWEPYDISSPDIMVLGPRCNTPLWRSRCPLINYAIIEFHHPERVMRQFGMRQYIPPDIPAYEHTLHDVDRRGRSGEDWVRYHREYVSQWANRHQFIIINPPITGSDSTEPRYMNWYDGITRRLISPSHLPMEEGYQPSHISDLKAMSMAVERIRLSADGANEQDIASLMQLRSEAIHATDDLRRLLRRQQDAVNIPVPPPQDTTRRTRRRTRTRGAFTSHVSTSYDIPHPLMSSVADEVGPSTSTHRVSHDLDSTADYYVPQQAQLDDSFTPYWGMPLSTMSFSTLLTSDLDMAQTPFVQQHIGYDFGRGDFTVSPIVFPHLDSDYHDRGESTSITSSDQSHDIAAAQGGRRDRRQRQRRTCGTGGHF